MSAQITNVARSLLPKSVDTSMFRYANQSHLTSKRSYYRPSFERRTDFSKITKDDVTNFENILTKTGVLTADSDPDAVGSHNVDWMRKFKGHGSVVLRPKNTEQVSSVLKYCNQRKLAVVPQGGNTGLVGGSVPVFDEIVLSTSLMNQILSFDEVSGIITCQSGVVLANLESFLHEKGHTVPLDLGAKGSCQIGGNIATNAGGVRLLRYGSLHGNVLGLEVVMADGTVVDNLTSLRKDNTGYDLKQLFIGSEGTLGVITKASILTPPKPESVNVAFFGCKSFDAVKQVYVRAKKELGEILSAVEFEDRLSMEMVLKHIDNARDPFQDGHEFYVLIETSGSNKEHDEAKLNAFLEKLMNEEDIIQDGTIAQQTTQITSLWKLRESISESLQRAGVVYKYDISLPLSTFYDIVESMRQRIGSKGTVVGYGHIGDGNLHLNISTPTYDKAVFDLIEPYVYEWTAKQRGSISAEHGIGVAKPQFLHFSKPNPAINLMRNIKNSFDPNGILNPYKVIPDTIKM